MEIDSFGLISIKILELYDAYNNNCDSLCRFNQ